MSKAKLKILNLIDIENDVYMSPITSRVYSRISSILGRQLNSSLFRGIMAFEDRPSSGFGFRLHQQIISRPFQYFLDLSLFFYLSLLLSNYSPLSKNLICVSAQNGSSAQLWASLVHFKSRL